MTEREAQAAIEFAVDECGSHTARFAFLKAVREGDEKKLLNWPAWLTKREQIRSAFSHAAFAKSRPAPDAINRFRL